jgi:hypothetical protein
MRVVVYMDRAFGFFSFWSLIVNISERTFVCISCSCVWASEFDCSTRRKESPEQRVLAVLVRVLCVCSVWFCELSCIMHICEQRVRS